MKKSILFWFLLVPVLSYSQIQVQTNDLSNQIVISPGENIELHGKIISEKNEEPLPFVNMVIEQNGKRITGGQSDFNGFFCIKPIPAGRYTLKIGGYNFEKKELNIQINKNIIQTINIKLKQNPNPPRLIACGYRTKLIEPNDLAIDLFEEQNLKLDSLDTLLPSYQLINNPLESSITIYPNPSSGLVKVTNPLTTKSFALYDLSGKIVFEQTSFNQKNLTLDITTYQKGMYILKIEDEQGIQVHQIIRN